MIESIPTSADVERATSEDIAYILKWLEQEYDEDGSGFWCNRHVIDRALDEAGLWVIRRKGQAVAFQVGDYSADIVSVHKKYRNCGMGTALFSASAERAKSADVNVLSGQCAPITSLGFWKRMGFEQYRDRYNPNDVMVRRVFSRHFELPSNSPLANVTIGFYPEEVLYSSCSAVPPISKNILSGARLDDGSITLERRVLGIMNDVPRGNDLTIKIEIDRVERCFCKAKYDEARNAGVKRDWHGSSFFIDCIQPLAAAG